MSLAAQREAIHRALAAAFDDKDRPYHQGEAYSYDEERQKFIVKASEFVLLTLADLGKHTSAEGRAERKKNRPAPPPREVPPPRFGQRQRAPRDRNGKGDRR